MKTITKYFLDTEFIEDGKTIDLISIGLVCEDGRTLYLQNAECKFQNAGDWVWRHVYPHLLHFDMRGKRSCCPRKETYDSGLGHRYFSKCNPGTDDPCPWAERFEIRDTIKEFCDPGRHGTPEFWGYYADYDWVVFCQLFGAMIDLPKGYPMHCCDLKQWALQLGNPRLPHPEVEVHHALVDAEWVKEAYDFLTDLELKRRK